jgi:hypothetical protein
MIGFKIVSGVEDGRVSAKEFQSELKKGPQPRVLRTDAHKL